MRWAKGRADTTRSCARLRREAAIIFIALVICCVDLTARIRRRRSMSEGIGCWPRRPGSLGHGGGAAGQELLAELGQRALERPLDVVVEDLLLGDAGQHAGVARFEKAIEILLVAAQVLDRHVVQ